MSIIYTHDDFLFRFYKETIAFQHHYKLIVENDTRIYKNNYINNDQYSIIADIFSNIKSETLNFNIEYTHKHDKLYVIFSYMIGNIEKKLEIIADYIINHHLPTIYKSTIATLTEEINLLKSKLEAVTAENNEFHKKRKVNKI